MHFVCGYGKATKDGKTILGQNIDWYPGFRRPLKIKRNDGITQLTLSLGICRVYLKLRRIWYVCQLNDDLTDGFRLNIPLACYLPKAMRQKNISDALGVLCQAARGVGYYHLASAEGDMVGIESVFDDFNILYSENDTLIHSNHYLTERFKKGDLAYMGIPDSYLRLPRIRDLIRKNYGQITPATMMDILSDHNSYPLGICRHYDNETQRLFNAETLASFIMVPEDRKMYIAWGTPCQYEYVTYEL